MLREVLQDTKDVLFFRLTTDRFEKFGWPQFFTAIVLTWIVGVGRHWDDAKAEPIQKSGVGSIAYVLALSLVVWALAWPFREMVRWTYQRVVAYIGMVSPPALLYAIPVERFMSLEAAQRTNFWFLAIVALWRVLLLVRLHGKVLGLEAKMTAVVTMLPLSSIVATLAVNNLGNNMMDIMSGQRGEVVKTVQDKANEFVTLLGCFSFLVGPATLLAYVVWLFQEMREQRPIGKNEPK